MENCFSDHLLEDALEDPYISFEDFEYAKNKLAELGLTFNNVFFNPGKVTRSIIDRTVGTIMSQRLEFQRLIT